MANDTSSNKRLYKQNYFIVFYEYDDETYVASFDSVVEILEYKNMPINRSNKNLIYVELYRALRRPGNITYMLNGKRMHVYLIDIDD